jgi:hypothetical protein
MDGAGTAAWLTGVELDSGAVEGEWTDGMEHRSAVVVCVSEVQPVTSESIDCVYVDATQGGSGQTVTQRWMPTARLVEVFALGSGDLLGIGSVRSAPAVCPPEQAPEALALVLPAPGAVEQWATEHIWNGTVR